MVAEVPIELAVQGSFHRIANFFDEISRMPRIIHVKNIVISLEESTPEAAPLLVEGDIVAFRLLTEEERKKRDELRKKRKKKGRK